MVLQFLCPNGHKVHCSEDRAGQPAKCPRCGVKFRIPTLEEINQAELGPTAPGSSVAAGSASGLGRPASGVNLGAATGPDQIEFLCPNDHLLHGPASLQGRPGQCPQCGSRFRIPTYPDATQAEPQVAKATGPSRPSPDSDSSRPVAAEAPNEGPSSSAKRDSSVLSYAIQELAVPTTPLAESHPVAQLLQRLWAYKSQGATVEIRYGEGHRLTPDHWVKSLGSATHAVFAVLESNGSYTLTAVPWESIHVILARNVKRLPES